MSRELAYLEIVEKIESTGLDEKFIYEHFPEGAARPMISLSDDGTRTKALNYAIGRLKDGEKITQGELGSTINGWLDESVSACPVGKSPNARSDVLPNGNKKPLTQPSLGHPNHDKFAPQPGTVPVTDAPPQLSLAEQCRDAVIPKCQKCGRVMDFNTVSGWFCNGCDGTKESPAAPQAPLTTCEEPPVSKVQAFQTAAQLKAHEADPLGVDQMFPPANVEAVPVPAAKTEKELFMEACDQAYKHGKPDFRQEIDEKMLYHPSWKNPGTVIYFCVTDPKGVLTGRK